MTLLLCCVLCAFVGVEGQSRVFTSCSAVGSGHESAAVSGSAGRVRTLCGAAFARPPSKPTTAKSSTTKSSTTKSSTTKSSTAASITASTTASKSPSSKQTTKELGWSLDFSEISREAVSRRFGVSKISTSVSCHSGTFFNSSTGLFEDLTADEEFSGISKETALSVSATGGVPFSVEGGDPTDIDGAFSIIQSRSSRNRPKGTWYTIVAVDIMKEPDIVWKSIKNLGSFLSIALTGLGAHSSRLEDRVYHISLDSGEYLKVKSEQINEADRFQIIRLTKLSPDVFPGLDFEDTAVYVQVLSRGFMKEATNIELGWGIPKGEDVRAYARIEAQQMESLLLEMLENLEAKFGQVCESGRNLRTIEGDCNNLEKPEQGSSGSPLRRLGGSDPSYPGRDRSDLAGPTEISPREISNKLFAMSPGVDLLKRQAKELTECISGNGIKGTVDVLQFCPLESVTLKIFWSKQVIRFKRIKTNDCEELVFVYAASRCTIEVLFKCSGESRVDFANNPCGAKTNRFFSPAACTVNAAEDSVLSNSVGLTDLFFAFGQFVDHDLGLTPTSQISRHQPGFSKLSRPANLEEAPIEIPHNDFHFPDQDEFPFERSRFSEVAPLSHVNQHSSYLDGSQIYGFNVLRARALRSFEGGRLGLSDGNLPPFNKINGPGALGAIVENGPNTDGRFFVVGDPRGSEETLLLALHIVFLREHNRVADEIAAAFPDFDDERIYQTARAIVIAEYQSIIYKEWLPRLLGPLSPDPSAFSYSSQLDATISTIFSTAAFRFGHTLVGTNLLKMGPGPRAKATMELTQLRDLFFAPEQVSGSGLDSFLRGGAWHACKELDHKIVDELRNFLLSGEGFDVGKPLVFDLISLNIQRARDMGLPSFNDARRLFKLKPYKTFSEFIKDPNLANLASIVYKKDVDNVDLFFGDLVEEHIDGAQVGETLFAIIIDQFERLRDGDRFFYTGIDFDDSLIRKSQTLRAMLNRGVTLAEIIVRNTNIKTSELGTRASVFQQ